MAEKDILLNIRSTDATTVDADFTHHFVLSTPIMSASSYDYLELKLQSAQIPNSFLNISSINNALRVTETPTGGSATARDLSITPGNYDFESLKQELLSILNGSGKTLSNNYAISFSAVEGAYTYTISGGSVTFDMRSTVLNNCRIALGLTPQEHTFSTSLTSDRVIDLSGGSHCLNIRSNLTPQNVFTARPGASSRSNVLFTVPLTVGNFEIQHYQDQMNSFPVHLNIKIITSFSLQITDQENNPLDFRGAHWSLQMRFTIRDEHEDGVHPLEQSFDRLQNSVLGEDLQLQQTVFDVTTRMNTLHNAIPMIRQHLIEKRNAEMREREMLEQQNNIP